MQEKINKRRIITLMILVVVTVVVYFGVTRERRIAVPIDIFQVENLESIGTVELRSGNATVTLSYNGAYWRVNDRYDADGDMIRVLFATLQQARPRRAVASSENDSLFHALREHGVHVSLYSDEPELTFYAGGDPEKTQAYFADPRSGKVYVMTIPGYKVYVSGILELPEEQWRNKLVFGFNWRNFRALEAEFPDNPSENFRVAQLDHDFGVEGLVKTDTARLNTFLDDVSLLTVDTYLPEPGLRDSLQQLTPKWELRVIDIASRNYRLRVYRGDGNGVVFGLIGDDQPAVFSPAKVRRLERPRSFFAGK